MRRCTVMAVTALAVLTSIPAEAEMSGGGPLRKGNQCFHYSTRREAQLGGFGYWGDCPQAAGVTNTAAPNGRRRPRTAAR